MVKEPNKKTLLNIKNKEVKLTNFFLSGSIAIITIFLLITAYFWITNKYKRLRNEYTISQIEFVESQKKLIKNETERAIEYINFNMKQSEHKLKKRIQNRVENAYVTINNIYKQNKKSKTDKEIEKMILDALRPIRFNNSCYFITKMDGTEILFPRNPDVEGKKLIHYQDDLGNYIVKNEIHLIKTQKEGFISSFWRRENNDSSQVSERISFIKYFEPLNWYIGNSENYQDYLEEIQHETLLWLSNQRYGDEGYVFVNTYDGDALLMDGNIVQEKRNVWDLEDPNGVKVIQLERKATKNPNGDFIFYSWRRLTDSVIIPKMSFIKGVEEWRWMVGAGVYVEDIDSFIASKDKELRKSIVLDSLYIAAMVIVVFMLLIMLVIFISRNLKKNVTRFIDFFKSGTKNYYLIDKTKINYSEFKIIADYANKMITDLKESETRTQEEKAHYERLFDQSPEAIAYIDNESHVIRVNKSFAELFGYKEDELRGHLIDEFIVPEELKPEAIKYTKEIELGINKPIEAIRLSKNKEKLYVNIIGSPVKVDDKQLGVYVVYRDITNQKKYEKNLQEAKLKAEESDRLKTAFLTNLSHEIRTPLNAIIGFSGLLKLKDYDVDTRKNYLNILSDSSGNLLEIIDNIVDLSKIQSSTLVINKAQVNLNTLLDDIYLDFKELLSHKNINDIKLVLSKGTQNTDLNVYTDPKRIKQIFSNLIDNAIKFTDKGTVEFGYTIKNNILYFFVKDEGIGIEEKNINLIFELFRQVDNSTTRKYGGTGNGLALCKGILDLLDGEIFIESKIGQGTKVYFNIPVDTIEKETKQEKSKKDSYNWKSKNILIAEDDSTNFKLLESFLERTNANIHWVKNGQQVLDEIANNPNYDIILMDINMPKLNGNDALISLRKKGINIPVIAQTAYAMEAEKMSIIEKGYNDYVSKPINFGLLFDILSKYLN